MNNNEVILQQETKKITQIITTAITDKEGKNNGVEMETTDQEDTITAVVGKTIEVEEIIIHKTEIITANNVIISEILTDRNNRSNKIMTIDNRKIPLQQTQDKGTSKQKLMPA